MKNRSLVLLSGEGISVPAAEARSLFLAYDEESKFSSPSPRVIIAESEADPYQVGRRIAFSRRVGVLVEGKEEAARMLKGKRVRFRAFDLESSRGPIDPEDFLSGVDARIDLVDPELELTLVRAGGDHLSVTAPQTMVQGWSLRRPRRRPFFHPAAIFPKLSRALVNMSGCREGETFLDPFAGTGSLPLEASLVGAKVVAMDQAEKMARGGASNMRHFGQEWLGYVRADFRAMPFTEVDAVATDVPYGRASSTRGTSPAEIVELFLSAAAVILKPGRRLVLMHQKEVLVPEAPAFALLEEHDLHIHKLLTRTISILRRR